MHSQATSVPDFWLYARNAAQFVVSYPYFYLFPTLTIAHSSILARPAESERLSADIPSDSPNFFTAFIFPFNPFCVWVVEQLFRDFLTVFLDSYLGYFAKTITTIALCAPLRLLRTWAIVRGNRSSLRSLIDSLRSLKFASWLYYVGTLLLCEAVGIMVISPAALPFRQAAQDSGVILQQPDEPTSGTESAGILSFFTRLIGAAGIVVLLEWFPATVVSVRAALSLLDAGYGGGRGFWNDILASLRSVTPSLCGKLALYHCLGMIATVGTRVSLLVISWVFNLVLYLGKLEK